ncbi:hypothetical protein [Pseudomonas protegens]|nr:hypothetical protein [Pseudomonas protegens]
MSSTAWAARASLLTPSKYPAADCATRPAAWLIIMSGAAAICAGA